MFHNKGEEQMSDVYSFTTTPDDNFFRRIVQEANPKTNFIVVTERSTIYGPNPSAALLVRKDVLLLGLVLPTLPLAGKTLGEWLVDTVNGDFTAGEGSSTYKSPWTYALIQSDDQDAVDEELERIRNEARRIENIVNDRTVRVTVESL
jgi:hypothetical protein